MARVVWSERACADLRDIVDFISFDNPSAARSLHSKVLTHTKRLSDFPNSGRKVSGLSAHLDLREVIVHPCRVIYEVENKKVYVLRVIRTERNLRLYMLENYGNEQKRVLHEGK